MLILLLTVLQQPVTPAAPAAPTLPPSPIARLVIQPAEAAVQANDTLRLSVVAYDSAGKPIPGCARSGISRAAASRGTSTRPGW